VVSNPEAAKALAAVAREKELRLTVRGRRSGKARSVTIWFVVDDDAVAVGSLRDDRNWIRNARAASEVEAEIGGRRFAGRIRAAEPQEHSRIRTAMARKYLPFRIASWLGLGQKFTFRIEDLRPASSES
jgi:deazaflavin-dependent oxidoreductase (nitroreductase family)